ncbi:MAG: MarR family transcriptional regulator [Chloroflexi bacterium]|nr:MarR family transcriptional regulator [Chloroflexota bacterium]
MQEPEVSRAATHAWRQLYLTYSVIFKAIERSIAATNVTLPQALALNTIRYGEGPMTPSRLAHYLTQETQSVTGLIDRMERQGWVRRVRDLPDRRAIRLELTEAGARKLDETVQPGYETTERMFGRLSEKETVELTRLLLEVYEGATASQAAVGEAVAAG